MEKLPVSGRTKEKQVTLKHGPNVANIREWRLDMEIAITAAADRRDDRAREWVCLAMDEQFTIAELGRVPYGFERIDRLFVQALSHCWGKGTTIKQDCMEEQ